MPHPDPTAAAWERVLARLDGAEEPAAPTGTAAPDTPAGEALPAWWLALAAVPTATQAAPTPTPTPAATTAPTPEEEPFAVWLDRRRAERAARGG